jgi:hypothetical protein
VKIHQSPPPQRENGGQTSIGSSAPGTLRCVALAPRAASRRRLPCRARHGSRRPETAKRAASSSSATAARSRPVLFSLAHISMHVDAQLSFDHYYTADANKESRLGRPSVRRIHGHGRRPRRIYFPCFLVASCSKRPDGAENSMGLFFVLALRQKGREKTRNRSERGVGINQYHASCRVSRCATAETCFLWMMN